MLIPDQPLAYGPPMPLLGLGTYLLKGTLCQKIVRKALEMGYHHIDTALLYDNHADIAKGIEGTARDKLYVTSKFLPEHLDAHSVTELCDLCLKELRLDYLDLFLFHYPDRNRPMPEILHEMASLISCGKIKAMGVSNFTLRHLQDIEPLGLPIAVNQVEFHPYLYPHPLLAYCQEHRIQVVSYRPLGKGALTHDPFIETLATKYRKSVSQIILRWLTQLSVPTVVKTTSIEHLKENANIFDFELSIADQNLLSNLEQKPRFCESGWSDFDYV